jgi:hypothetical protein
LSLGAHDLNKLYGIGKSGGSQLVDLCKSDGDLNKWLEIDTRKIQRK